MPRCATALLAALFSVPTEAAEPVEAPRERLFSLSEIRDSLTAWRRSFRVVRLRSEGIVVRSVGDKPPWTVGESSDGDWSWAENGGRRLISFSRRSDGSVPASESSGTDGTTAFKAHWDEGELSDGDRAEPRHVILTPDRGIFPMPSTFPLAGLWWVADQAWLPDLFEREGRVRLDGHEVIDGVSCPRLKVAARSPYTDVVVVVLDPRHRFLPREVRGDEGFVPGESCRYVITSYADAAPGVPMPAAGTYTYGVDIPGARVQGIADWSWKVVEASLDDAVPADVFRPPIGPKTKVVDQTKPPAPVPPGGLAPASAEEPSPALLIAAGIGGVLLAAMVAAKSHRRGR